MAEDYFGGDDFSSVTDAYDEPQDGGYYDHIMTTKKYRDQEEMAKAIYNGDKAIKVRETENAQMRDYITKMQPYIPILEKALKDPAYQAELAAKKGNPNAATGMSQQTQQNPDAVKQIVESILGPKLDEYNARLTKNETNEILKTMRSDKEHFPYMTREVEDIMGKALSETNNSFPLNMKGLQWLYKAAVGEHLPKILEKERETITQKNYANFTSKSRSFTENDRTGNATGSGDDGDEQRARIKNASRPLFG